MIINQYLKEQDVFKTIKQLAFPGCEIFLYYGDQNLPMKQRLELLKANRILIQETLEHIQNVTNIGLKVTENAYNIAIALPNEVVSVLESGIPSNYVRSGAQLIFTQDPNNGIKVRHKMPQVKKPGEPLKGEIVTSIPASALNRQVIFNTVIEFLEKVQGEIHYAKKK